MNLNLIKKNISVLSLVLFILCGCGPRRLIEAQGVTDASTPLHLLKPDYPVRYGQTTLDSIKADMDKIYRYLDNVTPTTLVTRDSEVTIDDLTLVDTSTVFKKGDFRLISYEWGVTYGALLRATEVTKDQKFSNYTHDRLAFIAQVLPKFKDLEQANRGYRSPVHSVINPEALDDAGSMCAAMIKAQNFEQSAGDYDSIIKNYVDYIINKEFRLSDGILARNRPLKNTIWLDDLYMSLPALVQMGKYSGEQRYFDEVFRQFWLFSEKMFIPEKGLYRHGWVEGMEPHPTFFWARANGWALLTKVEILNVLSEDNPQRERLLKQYRQQVEALAALQHGTGFWHQLLDRNDSYLETSATAIYAYCIARGINAGWLNAQAYGPMVLQAWNAVSSKINFDGQIEGTCVGTGMGFDPAFYYHRPINKFAAHSYGPAILAAAEVYQLLTDKKFEINDSAVQF
ncbi:glycoside hydrolase family 88 protein [Sphingobacterium shayense]|uniref:glycoside hydrolase family 88/105 protein n=1 Tax=Sphingobacterium shayense TaxID=626343 RepID=UPI001554BDCE|nr:glycoside hydrolase family 88 protein [Sphingobacterium shayense]NQD71485.1 glycoside hydrolase family 88 protein [Sphingobacterium shayense]